MKSQVELAAETQDGPDLTLTGDLLHKYLQLHARGRRYMAESRLIARHVHAIGFPDQFSFYLLDHNQAAYPTADPSTANSLFGFRLDAPNTAADVYLSQYASATVTVAPTVPEPGAGWLLAAGVPAIAWVARRRGGRLAHKRSVNRYCGRRCRGEATG